MPPAFEPVLIVGAGPIGLACAIAARRRGLDPLVIDAGPVAASIVRYPIGMTFFTTPERLEIGGHPLTCSGAKATREEALKYYRGVARVEALRVEPGVRLVGGTRTDAGIACRLETRLGPRELLAGKVVLATGYFEQPNLLGVPGEDLPHVSHWFDEPHRSAHRNVVIVGGKNSAIETALECWRAGARVTLVYRGTALKPSVKYWLRPDFENRVKEGAIAAHLRTEVVAISPAAVTIDGASGRCDLPADRVYLLTGYRPDVALFRRLGIAVDDASGRPAHDPETLESSVPGVYLAGSVTAGYAISEVFIENGRFDGERIFGTAEDRQRVAGRAAAVTRPVGE